MEIKVGSKWIYEGEKLTVLSFVNEGVLYQYENGQIAGWDTANFLKYFKPYQEKYEWVKFDQFELYGENLLRTSLKETKQHEVLLNYNRYREQFDNVELDWSNEDTKWYLYCVNGEYFIEPELDNMKFIGTLYFSTHEHAETFKKLLEENFHE